MRILGSAHHRTRRAFVVSRAFVLGLFDRSFRARRRVTARTRHAPAVTRLRVRFVLNHAIAFRRSSRHGSRYSSASKRRIARGRVASSASQVVFECHTDHRSNRSKSTPARAFDRRWQSSRRGSTRPRGERRWAPARASRRSDRGGSTRRDHGADDVAHGICGGDAADNER